MLEPNAVYARQWLGVDRSVARPRNRRSIAHICLRKERLEGKNENVSLLLKAKLSFSPPSTTPLLPSPTLKAM
jgi:hypothetical protein